MYRNKIIQIRTNRLLVSRHSLHSTVYTGKFILVNHSRFILYGRLATFLNL